MYSEVVCTPPLEHPLSLPRLLGPLLLGSGSYSRDVYQCGEGLAVNHHMDNISVTEVGALPVEMNIHHDKVDIMCRLAAVAT